MLEKDDLIERAARSTDMDDDVVRDIVDALFAETRHRLAHGRVVEWPEFGRLVPADRHVSFEADPELLGRRPS